jgi:hypothetical protein
MSSLAIYAAPFDNWSNDTNDETLVDKKKNAHNRTQKRYPKDNYSSEKVNSVLQTLHNNQEPGSDDNSMGDYFNPPPKPQSAGVQKTISTENMQTISNGTQPLPNVDSNNNLDLNNFNDNYGDNKTAEKYYKDMIPNYNSSAQNTQLNTHNRQYYQTGTQPEIGNSSDILMQKLNYMIHLLEERQDEKTNNVTEEVVLYSFLGIFIIFVCDSFARAGKYIR